MLKFRPARLRQRIGLILLLHLVMMIGLLISFVVIANMTKTAPVYRLPAPDKVAAIASTVRGMLAEVAADGVTSTELERAKGQMRGQTALSYESPGSRMNRHGVGAVLGDLRTLEEILTCFDQVSEDDVRTEAARLFAQPATFAVVGPKLSARTLRQLEAADPS